MSDKQTNDSINRRSFLGAMSATSTAVGFSYLGSDVTAATNNSLSENRVEAVLNNEATRAIRDEFGDLGVDYKSARGKTITDDNSEYEVVYLETEFGQLEYYERSGESGMAVLRLVDPETDDSGRSASTGEAQLPKKYQHLPVESHAVYLSGEGGEGLIRSPTTNERDRLEQNVDEDLSDALVFASSNTDGFQIVRSDGSADDGIVTQVLPKRKQAGSNASPDLGAAYIEVESDVLSQAKVVSKSPEEISTQASLSDCISWCGACVSGATVCVRCAVVCAGSVTGIGAIACAVCLVASCTAGGYGCNQCYEDCQNFI